MAKNSPTDPEPEEPLPPHQRAPSTADFAQMQEITDALSLAIDNYLEGRRRRRLGGADITTMVMSLHNWHKMALWNISMQMHPLEPTKRKEFLINMRNTFVAGMNDLIKQIADVELHSAIDEAERKRVTKEEFD